MKIRKLKKVLFSFTLYFIGAFISWNFVLVPMNEDEFELCEQVAMDMNAIIPNLIGSASFCIQVTKDFSAHVDLSSKSIEVSSTHPFHYGKVVAKLKNGEPVIERKMQVCFTLVVNIIFGILFFLVSDLIINAIKKRIKKS